MRSKEDILVEIAYLKGYISAVSNSEDKNIAEAKRDTLIWVLEDGNQI